MNKQALSWIILLTLSIVWGSSFILMKRGLEVFSSEQVAGLRIGIAFVFLLPLLIKHYKIDWKRHFPGLVLMGLFGNLIPAFLFTKAETGISSSLAGMLNALTPVFTIVLGIFLFKTKTTVLQIAGVVIGLGGALLLISFDDSFSKNNSNNWVYASLVVLATFCYAISVNSIKKFLYDLNPIKAAVWAFCITGPIALAYLFSTDIIDKMKLPGADEALMFVAILAIFGSALSVIVFNILIKLSGPVFASSCTYLIPVVAIFWGLADNELVHIVQYLAMAIIVVAIYLINIKPKKR